MKMHTELPTVLRKLMTVTRWPVPDVQGSFFSSFLIPDVFYTFNFDKIAK
jgi:hypothetical protein